MNRTVCLFAAAALLLMFTLCGCERSTPPLIDKSDSVKPEANVTYGDNSPVVSGSNSVVVYPPLNEAKKQ